MQEFLKVLMDIVSTPAILIALVSILGLCLQKKAATEIVRGGIKTFVGFLVVTSGASIVSGALKPFGQMFNQAFQLKGVITSNEAIISLALAKYGSVTALIMLLGMFINILIARFTRFKFIYLTG